MTTRQEAWGEILESLRTGIISTLTDECVNSIELSYNHLPHHLKPCFLSFAAFPEDHVVSVEVLIWQWIAEGFVRKSDLKRLEDVAADYLNILIGRGLVMIARERCSGGVKACRIHDLLHDFCLRKANEELFLHVLKNEVLPFGELANLRRLCVHCKAEQFMESKFFSPHLRSLLFFDTTDQNERLDISFILRATKHLRVLAMDKIGLAQFPREVGTLVLLRYLAISVSYEVSPSIGYLTNLETLRLFPKNRRVKLPDSFWNLQKLRHLYSSDVKYFGIELPVNNLDSSPDMLELESLSTLCSFNGNILEKQLTKFPNIRQLKCSIRYGAVNGNKVVSFSFLSQLELLSLIDLYPSSIELILPESIKKLGLNGGGFSNENISKIAELPNLEVMKLTSCRFMKNRWHVEEGKFSKLKFLKLKDLDIEKWSSASDDQFPNLEKLVLESCVNLKKIPECLENVATLNLIEVRGCTFRTIWLAKKVVDFQKEMGNSVLQARFGYVVSCSDSSDSDENLNEENTTSEGTTSIWKRLLRR